MDLKSIKAAGPILSAGQQAAFYYARQRRRARERATPAEFNSKGTTGIVLVVVITTE